MNKVLVAGATGMVGRKLVALLVQEGYKVNVLSTSKNAQVKDATVFYWNPKSFEIDIASLEDVTSIINLAGASISERWTTRYKQEIYDSRTQTAETLFKALSKIKSHTISTYISASAVGYYPSDFDKIFTETDGPGTDFLAQVCTAWEASADAFSALNIRVVKERIGIVLSKQGGALGKLETIAKTGLSSPIGSGKQWMSWIHIDDLCGLILHSLQSENLVGAINAVAPNPVTNAEFTKTLAKVLKRPAFLPAVPAFTLKLLLGQMAQVVLASQRVSSQKIQDGGYLFKHPSLEGALAEIYS